MDIKEYLKDPCGSLSIPFWKHKNLKTTKHIHIFHEKRYMNKKEKYSKVEKYFRLIHYLKDIPSENSMIEEINLKNDIVELIDMINISYEKENIRISKKDIKLMISREVFCDNLWVNIKDKGKIIASGIAEYDNETKEGVLEWIQVLPEYQGLGYGKLIVNSLINRLSKMADFITVSGRMDNTSDPKKLYKSCGFVGNDIWYICKVK